MVRFIHVVLALLPLFSSAIVVKELPNATQGLKAALIQEHAAVHVGNKGINEGIPFIATSVQLSLTQLVDPVKEKLTAIKDWVTQKLLELQSAVQASKAMPGKALDEFATRVSELFKTVEDKLEPITTKLGLVSSPAIEGLQKVLSSTGYGGAADKIVDVMDQMSLKVHTYQMALKNATEIAESLKGLGKKDWHEAGPKIEQLKEYLDKGVSVVKTFGDTLSDTLGQALALLSNKMGVDKETFDPVHKSADEAWKGMEDSTVEIANGLVSSAKMLPPQLALEIDDKSGAPDHRGPAGTAVAAALTAVVAALVL